MAHKYKAPSKPREVKPLPPYKARKPKELHPDEPERKEIRNPGERLLRGIMSKKRKTKGLK